MAKDVQTDGGKPTPPLTKSGAKRVWRTTIAIFVLVLAAAGGSAYWWHASHNKKPLSLSAAEQAANKSITTNDFGSALASLQAAIPSAHTTAQKSSLYNQLAAAAQNAGHPKLAIQYYLDRHTADPSTAAGDAESLGQLYQQVGEYSQAIAQYRQYINYVSAHAQPPLGSSDEVAYLNGLIKSLQAQEAKQK